MSHSIRPVFLSYVELLILLGFMLTAGFLVGYYTGHVRGTAICAEGSATAEGAMPMYFDGDDWKVIRK